MFGQKYKHRRVSLSLEYINETITFIIIQVRAEENCFMIYFTENLKVYRFLSLQMIHASFIMLAADTHHELHLRIEITSIIIIIANGLFDKSH